MTGGCWQDKDKGGTLWQGGDGKRGTDAGGGPGGKSEDVTGLPAELETHSCTAQWGHGELGKLQGRKAGVREP